LRHKNVILFCGRLVKLKGIEYLIKAFAELAKSHRNTFLLVMGGPIGDGGKCNPAELENMCRSFGISNVLFLGPVYGPEKTIYFLLADVLVAPSVFDAKNSDVWGFAINEAMSLGKPVIATKAVGAAYDLIKNGVNGFIVGDKDPEALSRAIASIINNPLLKKRMGTQSLRIIRDGFTYEHMVYGFAEAIEYALRSRRSEVNTQAVRSSS
jgi:glycosyltransferase involved in cell wall biosynthesis